MGGKISNLMTSIDPDEEHTQFQNITALTDVQSLAKFGVNEVYVSFTRLSKASLKSTRGSLWKQRIKLLKSEYHIPCQVRTLLPTHAPTTRAPISLRRRLKVVAVRPSRKA